MELTFTPKSGYLHFELSGQFEIQEACRCFTKAIEHLSAGHGTKVLIDCHRLAGTPSSLDYFLYGQYVATELFRLSLAGHNRIIHLVYVAPHALLDKAHFGQIVATDRGVSVKSVHTLEEAHRWLQLDASA
jgi:hypothetical protein